MLVSFSNRFKEALKSSDMEVAATIHPSHRLRWIKNDKPRQTRIINEIKRRVREIREEEDVEDDVEAVSTGRSSSEDSSSEAAVDQTSGKRPAANFFNYLSKKKRRSSSSTRASNDEYEIDKYLKGDLSDPKAALSENLPDCLVKLYLQLNTALPSSAGAERLFSLAGRVLSSLRNALSDNNFEMLVFLKSNWEVLNVDEDIANQIRIEHLYSSNN